MKQCTTDKSKHARRNNEEIGTFGYTLYRSSIDLIYRLEHLG